MKKIIVIMLACLFISMSAKLACAGPTDIEDNFILGASESFETYLDTPTDGTSSSLYNNYVRVQVSGVALADVPNGPSDSFYYWDKFVGTPVPAPPYDLHVGFGNGSSNVNDGAQQIIDSIVFINGVGWAGGRPAWAVWPNHSYDFVINAGGASNYLTLGTGDPNYEDNFLGSLYPDNPDRNWWRGHYDVTLTALTVVPEPVSSTLFLVGSGFLGICYHRKKKMRASA